MNAIPLSRKNFQTIIQFYLFESPVRTYTRKTKQVFGATTAQPHPEYDYYFKKVSKRGITFADRGIDGSKLNSLRAAMKRVTGVELLAVNTNEEVIEKVNAFKKSAEFIVIKRGAENKYGVSVTEGYFYCIRNAFAHGDFEVEGKIYTLRNEDRGKVKGLARLKESSLLTWIDLVNMDIESIKLAGKK